MISICIPCKDTRPYLGELKASILGQTFQDFEVVVVDDASTDGSREFFDAWAVEDRRVCVFEGPGQGLYPGWNAALERAKGEFIYIATSDDLMATDCLEKLHAALCKYPKAGLAYGRLKVFGDHADKIQHWWERLSPFAESMERDVGRSCYRPAPLDGMLHYWGKSSVLVSVTQMLFRRELLLEAGYFDSRWGPAGDTHWFCRAGLLYDTVYVPETWGGWRRHPAQATPEYSEGGEDPDLECRRRIFHAARKKAEQLNPELAPLYRQGMKRFVFWQAMHEVVRYGSISKTAFELIAQFFRRPGQVCGFLWDHFRGAHPMAVPVELRIMQAFGLSPSYKT